MTKRRVNLSEARSDLRITLRNFGMDQDAITLGDWGSGLFLQKDHRELTTYRLTAREMAAGLEVAAQMIDQASKTGGTLPNGAIILSPEQAAALKEAYKYLYDYTNGRAHTRITGAQLALDKAPCVFDMVAVLPTATELHEKGYTEISIAKTIANGNATY